MKKTILSIIAGVACALSAYAVPACPEATKILQPDGSYVTVKLVGDEYFDGDRAEVLLQEAIASLPEVQKVVFSLRYYDDMKYSEISSMLGTSEGALKASYHLAVKKIRAYLDNND